MNKEIVVITEEAIDKIDLLTSKLCEVNLGCMNDEIWNIAISIESLVRKIQKENKQ